MANIIYIHSINRTVAKIAGFDISFSVFIPTDKDPVKIYDRVIGGRRSINLYLEYPSCISVTLPRPYGSPVTDYRAYRFTMGPLSRSIFCKELKKFLKIFDNDDVFYLDEGKLCEYNSAGKYDSTFKVGDNFIRLHPAVVTDMNNNSYEGAVLYLNTGGMYGEISYSELEALYDIIHNIDFFLYSQALLSYIRRPEKKRPSDGNIPKITGDLQEGIDKIETKNEVAGKDIWAM